MKIIYFILFFLVTIGVNAQTRLPDILSDNMCLQQSAEVQIWGWDTPGQKVVVDPSWGKHSQTITGEDGSWLIRITTPKAGKTGRIKVTGSTQQTIENIAFGEVWLCSGQSNMERELGLRKGQKPIVNFWEEAKKANYPKIRMFKVATVASQIPLSNCQGKWVVCNQKTVFDFSAVGYFYAQALHESLSVPVGLIQSSRGGTPAEAWTPEEGIDEKLREKFKTLETSFQLDSNYYRTALDNYKNGLIEESPDMPESVSLLRNKYKKLSVLYNGMISPLTNYTIKGVIWYQGEANVPSWKTYKTLFPNMISSWREKWGIGDFPFYFVQIPPHNYGDKYGMPFGVPKIVEAQCEALKLPNTGVAATQDIGTFYDIHPPHKKEVGRRLSLIALHKTYNKTDIVYAAPFLSSYKNQGEDIVLQIETPGSELYLLSAAIGGIWAFHIAGENKIFYPAKVRQDGNKIRLNSPKVKHPVAVRYNWANNANATIYNKQGLPALPFRTDDWDEFFYGE
ncbi:sialate O-acetylesterase [Fulvivirga sp. M361]|uniref:sialate O-acetylesterase n=1 Tax=Fulvivirga sp. M361 TaxID=2594266 RepID=UPI00117A81BA|nr:sialate O-acetylesterase [Fulvivirga sp. M361]TRX59237.1 sialate O-acetylesterase [Fulvivirga sp. M361]